MEIKTAKQLAAAAEAVAKNYKTLYIMGCFGAPMTAKNKKRYSDNHKYNRQPERKAMINAASADTFGFDCVCLIKGLLWGWNGDQSKVYGGAKYASNGVPDVSANGMMNRCTDVSTDFSKIEVGEVVHKPGHIGIYIGNGLAVESTPSWANGVQITAVKNIGTKAGYKARSWTQHGKLPYVSYEMPAVIYRVYAGGQWLEAVSSAGYGASAGKAGEAISGLQVKLSNGQSVTVRSHICGKARADWLAPVTAWDDSSEGYSGWKGKDTDCIAMKAEGHALRYRVHVMDGDWLPWVTGYDISDYEKGLAGVYGKPIDAVQIETEN